MSAMLQILPIDMKDTSSLPTGIRATTCITEKKKVIKNKSKNFNIPEISQAATRSNLFIPIHLFVQYVI